MNRKYRDVLLLRGTGLNANLRTAVALVQDIAEEEAADAYDALFSEILELREEVAGLRREIGTYTREVQALRRGVLEELERLRETLA